MSPLCQLLSSLKTKKYMHPLFLFASLRYSYFSVLHDDDDGDNDSYNNMKKITTTV